MKNKIFLTPIIFIGVIFLILGISWIVVDEPWMLDKVANEERLNMTFDQLFNEEINAVSYTHLTLPTIFRV